MGFIYLLTPCLVSFAAAGSSYLPCGRTIGFAVRLARNLLNLFFINNILVFVVVSTFARYVVWIVWISRACEQEVISLA